MPLVRNRNSLSDPKHIFYRQLLLINGAFSLNHVCPLFNSNERVVFFLFWFFVFKSEIEFTRFTVQCTQNTKSIAIITCGHYV